MEKIGLAEAIQNLRDELTRARRAAEGQELQFAVGDIEIELALEAERSAKAGGGINWWIFKAEAEGSAGHKASHKLVLKLSPKDRHGRNVDVSNRRDEPGSKKEKNKTRAKGSG